MTSDVAALGMVLRQMGDMKGAMREFQASEALNKARMNTQAAILLTHTRASLLRQGNRAAALSKLQAALKTAPDFAPAHYEMALALLDQGEKTEAQAEFEKARQLDPRLKPPRDETAAHPRIDRGLRHALQRHSQPAGY